ncbi:MAG TPA: hypothetical protein VEQ42_04325 [Pyrinomonadaceae bacterium]|nr:hypothetical protein [Pyrinomonadaceae bacterium]
MKNSRTLLLTFLSLSAFVCQCAPARPQARASNAAPSPSPAATPRDRFTEADFARHVAGLKKRLPHGGFTIVVEPPFVVVGDGPASAVRAHAADTVRWAVERLKQDFFEDDPADILDIWLFKDEASYRDNARRLFRSTPDTPYGYYSRADRALVMNISTGGGTLVHEIVHPFMEANFPACPPWFNEGLGSLYEQCGDVDGRIHGFTNWRLPGLQRAVRARATLTFEKLTSLDARAFYGDARGTNYAQARYLLYYLQERGLLTRFYREFRAGHREDPTGYKTLRSVLGETDMAAFQKRWEAFVLGLGEERLTPVAPR